MKQCEPFDHVWQHSHKCHLFAHCTMTVVVSLPYLILHLMTSFCSQTHILFLQFSTSAVRETLLESQLCHLLTYVILNNLLVLPWFQLPYW